MNKSLKKVSLKVGKNNVQSKNLNSKKDPRIIKKSRKHIIFWAVLATLIILGLILGLAFGLRFHKWDQPFHKNLVTVENDHEKAMERKNEMLKNPAAKKGWGLFLGSYSNSATKEVLWGKAEIDQEWQGDFGKYLIGKGGSQIRKVNIPWLLISPEKSKDVKKAMGKMLDTYQAKEITEAVAIQSGSAWPNSLKNENSKLFEAEKRKIDNKEEIVDLKIDGKTAGEPLFVWFIGSRPVFYTNGFSKLKAAAKSDFFGRAEEALSKWEAG